MKRTIWFTSDQHFNHKSILDFTDRPFKNIEEMNTGLINRWNKKVKPNDMVYILGDFIWNTTKTDDYKKIMKSLNGQKILIIGNHDDITPIRAMNLGFNNAINEAKIKIAGELVVLSHYPYRFKFLKEMYIKLKVLLIHQKIFKVKHLNKRPKDMGDWLLFGHTHQTDQVRGKTINIGVDAWNFEPVSINKIVEIIKGDKK